MRVVIVEPNIANHAIVRQLFNDEYPNQDIEVQSKLDYSSLKNSNVRCVINTYTFIEYIQDAVKLFYPKVQFFGRAINDNYIFKDGLRCPIIVSCGAGINENEVGFSDELEFWDSYNPNLNIDKQLQSAIKICAKMLKVRDILNCEWYEARIRCRNNSWNETNGFGLIDVKQALLKEITIGKDSYLSRVLKKKMLIKVSENLMQPQILYLGVNPSMVAGKAYKFVWDIKNITGKVLLTITVNLEEENG